MTKPVSVILRGEPEGWGAWSPQCPGLVTGDETEAGLLQSLPDTIAWCFEGDGIDDDFVIHIHVEREVGGGVVTRVARDENQAARQEVADRIVAALAVPDLAARLRSAPPNWAGEVVYVCALPTDTQDWLDDQLEEKEGAVNVAVPVAGGMLWVRPFGGQPAAGTADGRAATFAEATRAPDRQRVLVPA